LGLPTPFYPDFLWWIGDTCFAIDPTGANILNEKVRGKLLTIAKPKIVLITRGRVSRDFASLENEEGWSMVRPPQGRAPSPEYFVGIRDALVRLANEAGAKAK
jgi:type III restriction enzyme